MVLTRQGNAYSYNYVLKKMTNLLKQAPVGYLLIRFWYGTCKLRNKDLRKALLSINMVSKIVTTEPVELKLRFGAELVSYLVSPNPARNCTKSEIPVIDLAHIDGSYDQRAEIAMQIRNAAETSGFFYIMNHGILRQVIENAYQQAKR